MPRFLESRLKKRYGNDSSIPYRIMNSLGYMRGNKETAKGREADRKHRKDVATAKRTGGTVAQASAARRRQHRRSGRR